MKSDKVSTEQDRQRDTGHFDQYGMRNDPRDTATPAGGENPATGDGGRRFGAGGDESSYGNRERHRTGDQHSDHLQTGPLASVDASGSARALGLEYGGDQPTGPKPSSRQGAALIGETDDRKR
ncbi:hypothetical protein [Paracidovorax konjaci]|uniref:Uncharacterized protein n=1 Tax=Paracidovorax konjaci TaxID=32040 RepID=A0A1I1XTF0_9BURK|nr:hypothetical protein [Paracidovorax konjaci]SFE10617.1 hypothetical protein SAMN04489710_114107 [Paracidovorax konjaci]